MIIHFTQYWQYINLKNLLSLNEGNRPSKESPVIEIVGFCIGFLSAAVTSAAGSQEQLCEYAAVALRLATLMGALGDAQEKEEVYTSLAVVWKAPGLEKELPRLLEGFPEVRLLLSCFFKV
jgi:hypothetical protein